MATYHRGELAVQARAGLLTPAGNAVRAIRSEMPEAAMRFLAEQHVVFLGGADAGGRLWTTMLGGAPGFVRAADPVTVVVDALPGPADPAFTGPVGMIALEAHTRRRMRVNGRATPTATGATIDVEQVISNCPKHIQTREPIPLTPRHPTATRTAALSDAQRVWIGAADTFYITTSAGGSADTSHRGGSPGFVRAGRTTLSWPDYQGNAMFLTLGNLDVHPAAGLLFPDWETGATLHLTGTAVVDWSPERAATVPGAQRMVDFTVTEVVQVTGAMPWRWSPPGYSRFNPPAQR